MTSCPQLLGFFAHAMGSSEMILAHVLASNDTSTSHCTRVPVQTAHGALPVPGFQSVCSTTQVGQSAQQSDSRYSTVQ